MSGDVIITMCAPAGAPVIIEPTVTITGTWTPEPLIHVIPQQGFHYGGNFYSPAGAWIDTFTPIDTGVTTLALPNLVGVIETFQPSLSAATSINVSALEVVEVTFSPIDMPLLTTLNTTALIFVGGNFGPNNLATLTVVNTPALTTVFNNYEPQNLAALTDLLAPSLTFVGGGFTPATLPLLDTVDFTALVRVGGAVFFSTVNALVALDLSALVSTGAEFNLNSMQALTTLDVSALTTIGGQLFIFDTAQVTITFGALQTTGGQVSCETIVTLTDFVLSAIVRIGVGDTGGITFTTGTDALDTFTLGSGLLSVGGDVLMTSCALLQASVDSILVRLAALDGTAGTTSYDNHTVTITGTSATPSATGLTAKATLEGRGNTVTVN